MKTYTRIRVHVLQCVVGMKKKKTQQKIRDAGTLHQRVFIEYQNNVHAYY